MVRLDAETKQITHAIRMAAYNAETALARALDGHYARAGDEAYARIREALTVSGDICPGNGELLILLDPLTAPRRTQALAALCDQLTAAGARYPAPTSSCATRSNPQTLHKRSPHGESWTWADISFDEALPFRWRDQGRLFPVDLRTTLPSGHLCWRMFKATGDLDLTGFQGRHRDDGGAGAV